MFILRSRSDGAAGLSCDYDAVAFVFLFRCVKLSLFGTNVEFGRG